MTDISSIVPKRNERMLLVGKTRTGKTTLAMQILPHYQHVLAIDPLHVLRPKLPPGYTVAGSPQGLPLAALRSKLILYQPRPEHMNWASYDAVYRWAFDRKNTMIYTDEGLRVMRANGQAPPYMEACYTAGRQRGVGMITCTQRPAKVDLRVMSEAEHYVCFQLKLRADRERMAEVMEDERVLSKARGHSFWHINDRSERLNYYTLILD